jgi:nicotinamide mononucleotide transporter
MDQLLWLLDARVHVLGSEILWREIVGNAFGFASAVGGMRRKVWAWPVGITGNVLLFTVFLGGVFATPQAKDLYGQAGRQVFFLAVSLYGWWRWHRNAEAGPAVIPRWATAGERLRLALLAAAGIGISYVVLDALDSWGPLADSWILIGSLLATYSMARGYVEFWLVWIAVDAVGVPLLIRARFYPSALLYGAYGVFCVVGFMAWRRAQQAAVTSPESAEVVT